MPIKIKCQICGKIVIKPPSERNRKYCSTKCYGVAQKSRDKRICSIPECNLFVQSLGFCNRHYLRYKRYGNPLAFAPKKKRKTYIRIKPLNKYHKNCLSCGKSFETYRQKAKYCNHKCYGLHIKKPFILKSGYKKILLPTHPRADRKGYVFEHILILESNLNRSLYKDEVTHHLDNNKLNNNPINLIVCKNNSEHIFLYHSERS